MKNLKAIILAGGSGTRLKPITCHIPKPLAPIGGFPCIYYILDLLKQHGIENVWITLKYKSEMIIDAVKDITELNIRCREEREALGTAGAVSACDDGTEGETLVICGDCICDFDLTKAVNYHRQKGGGATVVLTRVSEPLEYGIVLTDEDGAVTKFIEKPSWSRAYSDTVNTGIYIFSENVLKYIPKDTPCDFAKDVFPRLMQENIRINGYTARGYWCDIGSLSAYMKCNMDLIDGKINVSPTLSVFRKNSTPVNEKEQGYFKQHSVTGNGCVLKKGATVTNCVLMDNVTLEENVYARNCVICHGAVMKEGSSAGDNCVIGADCVVGKNAVIGAGCKIYPENVIADDSFVKNNVIDGENPLRYENGKIYYLLNKSTDTSLFVKVGAAFALTIKQNIAVGLDKTQTRKNLTPAALALCSGITSVSENVFHMGECDVNVFRYALRNGDFGGGIFICTEEEYITLTLFEGDGLGLCREKERCFESALNSGEIFCTPGGEFRFSTGCEALYGEKLTENTEQKQKVKAILSAPEFITKAWETENTTEEKEYIYVMPQRLVVQKQTHEAYDSDLIKCVTAYCCGMMEGEVFIPYDYPVAMDTVAKKYGFKCTRLTLEDEEREKLYAMSDTYLSATYVLRMMAEKNVTFGELSEDIPTFSSRHREVEVSANKAAIMKLLALGNGRELVEGIKIKESGGTVHIVPQKIKNAFHLCAESSDGETAAELCDFYAKKLKK